MATLTAGNIQSVNNENILNGTDFSDIIDISFSTGTEFRDESLLISAGNGDDEITSRYLTNIINADGGNDLINILNGVYTVDGGDGNDTVKINLHPTKLRSFSNDSGVTYFYDSVSIEVSNVELFTFNRSLDPNNPNSETITLTLNELNQIYSAIDQTIIGTSSNDMLLGGLGNDTIDGLAGDDELNGSDGNDILNGGDGNDTLNGGLGDDTIDGGNGEDTFYLGTSFYSISSYSNDNDLISITTLFDGTDNLKNIEYIAFDLVTFSIEYLNDYFSTEPRNINGTADSEVLDGRFGNDIINGNDGDDTINGGSGVDSLTGGDGNDVISGDDGNDIIAGNAGDDGLNGDNGDDDLNGGDGNDGVSGGTGNDVLRGGNGGDFLYGGDGADLIYGDADNDYIFGGYGNDIIYGGDGLDIFYIPSLNNRFVGDADSRNPVSISKLKDGGYLITSGYGHDQIHNIEYINIFSDPISTPIEELLAAKTTPTVNVNGEDINPNQYSGPVEYLEYEFIGESSNDIVVGSLSNDFFNLKEGDDAAEGGIGDDVLDGGAGSNFLTGGEGNDTFFLDGRDGDITWSTITDFNGDEVNIWGWNAGVSKLLSSEDHAGADGFKGATLHYDLNNDGTIDTSITFSGLALSELPASSANVIEQNGYLLFN